MKQIKKSLAPVVATALILVVAVLSVVNFESFYSSFESSVLADLNDNSNSISSLQVQGVFDNYLYLNSDTKSSFSLLKIMDKNGVEMCSFSGDGIVNNSGLVGLWKFNDDSSIIKDYSGNGWDGILYGDTRLLLDFDEQDIGDIILDKSGYKSNGTVVNGSLWNDVDCIGGGCYSFDPLLENHLSFSNLDIDTSFGSYTTVSFWMKKGEINNCMPIAFSSGYNLWFLGDKFGFNTGNGDIYGINDSSFLKNTWHHIVAVFYSGDSTKSKLYIDGQKYSLLDVRGISPQSKNVSNLFFISGRYGSYYFNGSIDELAIYSREISQDEVTDLYNSRKAQFIEFKESRLDKSLKLTGATNCNDKCNGVLIPNSRYLLNDGINNYTFVGIASISNYSSHQTIIQSYNGPHGGIGLKSKITGFEFRDYGMGNIVNSIDHPKENKINLFVGISEGSTSSLYINNLLKDYRGTMGDNYFNTSYNYIFGEGWGGMGLPDELNGNLEEIRIYNRSLSQDEIDQLYWYSLKYNKEGLNEIDLSNCNLSKSSNYNLLAFTTNNQKLEYTINVK